jgi:Dolichyl-phosphate-mannose-protein mannosyltransferase
MPLDLGFLILLAILSAGLGYRVLGWLRATPEHPLDAWALAVPIGLGAISLSVLGLAEVGWLTPSAIAGLLAIGLLVGGKGGVVGTLASRPTSFDRGASGLVFWGLFGLTMFGTLLTSLAPVTDGDALCYHLQVPKVFLAHGSAVFEPDLHETIYPLMTEALYAVGLALRGPVACRLIQWLLGLVFAANVTAIARPSLGSRARWAGLIALLVPAISNGMSAPLNDVALAAFGNAAIHAWICWRDRPSWRSAVLAGVLMGLAIGVKYPALVLGGLLGIGFLTGWPAQRTRQILSHALVFGFVALVVGGAWYLRAYIYTGNPVYPFFRQVFGGSGIDEVLDPIKRPMPVTSWNLLTALGPLTLQPDRFDSFSHQFGPMFLLFLPPLLVMRPPRRVVGIVALGYAFLALCLTQRQSMRFVLIAVGPLSVGVAWLTSTWYSRRSIPGRLLICLFLIMMIFEASLAVARARHGLSVVLGRESADSFLGRREPTFEVGRWMEENLPKDSNIVGQDHRGFYFPRSYSMELAHRRRTGLGKRGESASEVIERLKGEGFTHVLLCPPVPENAVEFDPTLGRLLAPWLATARPLYRRDLGDADGIIRRYAIYALDPSFEEARR